MKCLVACFLWCQSQCDNYVTVYRITFTVFTSLNLADGSRGGKDRQGHRRKSSHQETTISGMSFCRYPYEHGFAYICTHVKNLYKAYTHNIYNYAILVLINLKLSYEVFFSLVWPNINLGSATPLMSCVLTFYWFSQREFKFAVKQKCNQLHFLLELTL